MNIGDIIVLQTPNKPSKKAAWEVMSIELGGEGQQDVVELKPLSLKANGTLRVPMEFIAEMRDWQRGISII